MSNRKYNPTMSGHLQPGQRALQDIFGQHSELRDQRDELLVALTRALSWHNGDRWRTGNDAQRAAWLSHREMMEAAIAKVKGGAV